MDLKLQWFAIISQLTVKSCEKRKRFGDDSGRDVKALEWYKLYARLTGHYKVRWE